VEVCTLSTRTLLVSSLLLASCATASSEEAALRDMAWDVATRCAGGKNMLVDRVDSYMRVWTLLPHGGQQDVPAFNKCYFEGTRVELAKRPDLQA
jgi:hypothetical protein